jgi:hypothetical protein
MKTMLMLRKVFKEIDRKYYSVSSLKKILKFIMILTLTACNPSTTKLGENFLAGIAISLSRSTLNVSNAQVATGDSVTVTLNLKDQNGVSYVSTRPLITFSASGGTSAGTFSNVANLGDGIYTATFTGVTPGSAKTIHAQVDGLTLTSTLPTVQVTTGNYSLLNSVITVSSSTVVSGSTVTATLTAKDISNTQLPDGGLSVSFSLSGGTSSGTWSPVTDNLDGTYTATLTGITAGTASNIHASIGGSTVTSTPPTFTVNFGAATKLAFVQGPTSTASGSTISPNVTVRALDANNNFVSTYGTDIIMSIDTNPSTGTLSGTLTKTPSGGVSTFNDLAIDYYGTGYRLSATSGSLTSAISAAFNITATAVTYDLPFTAITTPVYTTLYTSSSWSLMEFIGDLVRLTPTLQTDDAATTGTMNAGSASGVVMGALTDGLHQGIKLGNGGTCDGSSTNCSELDSTWTPNWSNIVAYWKLNEASGTTGSGSIVDSSPLGTNSGTPAASASLGVSGKLNNALSVNGGINSYVDMGTASSLHGMSSLTVQAWVYIPSGWSPTGTWSAIVDKCCNAVSPGGAIGHVYSLQAASLGSGNIVFLVNTASSGSITVPIANFSNYTGGWHHIVGTYDGTSIKTYFDGVFQNSAASSGTIVTNAARLGIGTRVASNSFGGSSGLGFTGYIDEVAIWNSSLTASQIESIYQRQYSRYAGTFTSRVMNAKSSSSWTTLSWIPTLPFYKELPDYVSSIQNETSTDYTSLVGSTGSTGANDLMTGVVGLWHLNEASGATSVIDDSGSGNNGTPTSVTFGSNGKLSTAASFNGSSSKISIAQTNLPTGNTAFSYSVWIKTTQSTSSGYPSIFSYGTATSANGLFFTLCRDADGNCNPGGTLSGRVMVGPYGSSLGSNVAVNDGFWHHVVATFDGTTYKIFIDGVASGSKNMATNLIHSTTPTIGYAGALSGSAQYFNGSIDEFSIWSRALHANEVKQLYQRGASRLKYQVRSCDDNACSGESWQGPDGTNGTYFSELNNNTTPLTGAGDVKATLPSMLFSSFTSAPANNQYFQYRTILESDATTAALWPELKSTTVDPIHYDISSPSIYGNNGIAFYELNNFAESLGSGGCSSGVGYNLSLDKVTWKYWNGSSWATANGTASQSNIASVIQTNTATFGTQVGRGTVYVKAYLKSSGTSKCEIDNINVGGNR